MEPHGIKFEYIAIVASDATNGIGRDGEIPWYLPGDLARFKKETTSHVCIMGRKTFESLPEKSRPLQLRYNIVLTRDRNWKPKELEVNNNLKIVYSITEARTAAEKYYEKPFYAPLNRSDLAKIYIIGGEQIYGEFLPLLTKLIWTRLGYAIKDPPCNVFFPTIRFKVRKEDVFVPSDDNDWHLESRNRLAVNAEIFTIVRAKSSNPLI